MSKLYFFSRDKYCRYDTKVEAVDVADTSITTDWLGLPSGVDAALNWGNGKTFFFVGSHYYRYDNIDNRVDDNDPPYPWPIAGNWEGLTLDPNKRVDACIKWDTKTAYFFQDRDYWAYDLVNDKAYPKYPRKIAGNWPPENHANILAKLSDFDFHHNLDGAVNWGNGKAYFFKGSKYVRYNMSPKNEGVDKFYPKDINDNSAQANWPGLFPKGVRSPVMLGYAGFDRSDYPGDANMQSLWENTNLGWCGFYLSPTPSHKDKSWMDGNVFPIVTRLPFVQGMGWKAVPIYMGQQEADVANTSHHASADQGRLDAGHAVTLAMSAGFAPGTILYLDIEKSPTKLKSAMLDYYQSWVETVPTLDFRPGVYCPFQYVQTLLNLDRTPAFWVVNATKFKSGTPNMPDKKRPQYKNPFPAPEPLLTTAPVASAWQLALDVKARLTQTQLISPWDCDSSSYKDPSSIP